MVLFHIWHQLAKNGHMITWDQFFHMPGGHLEMNSNMTKNYIREPVIL